MQSNNFLSRSQKLFTLLLRQDEEESEEDEEAEEEEEEVSDADDDDDAAPKTKKIKKTVNDWELINDAKALWTRSDSL